MTQSECTGLPRLFARLIPRSVVHDYDVGARHSGPNTRHDGADAGGFV